MISCCNRYLFNNYFYKCHLKNCTLKTILIWMIQKYFCYEFLSNDKAISCNLHQYWNFDSGYKRRFFWNRNSWNFIRPICWYYLRMALFSWSPYFLVNYHKLCYYSYICVSVLMYLMLQNLCFKTFPFSLNHT